MRIADLKTTRGDSCPEGWINNVAYKLRCTGGESTSCYSANFSTIGTHYTKVCGQTKKAVLMDFTRMHMPMALPLSSTNQTSRHDPLMEHTWTEYQ